VNVLDRGQPLGLLVLRLVAGVILVAHGEGKIFGGLHAHMAFVHSLGMPGWMGLLSAGTEFVGGILLIAGALVRLVGLALCIEMCVALAKVHWPKGDRPGGPADLALILAAVGFLFIWFGGGPFGVDGFLWGKGARRR
jgi:putative oxidoreductase